MTECSSIFSAQDFNLMLPDTVALRSLRAKPVVKALVKFFSTFDLPKCIQTDHRSNFISVLAIKHKVSSACQLESQGVLEGLHKTEKMNNATLKCGGAKTIHEIMTWVRTKAINSEIQHSSK